MAQTSLTTKKSNIYSINIGIDEEMNETSIFIPHSHMYLTWP